MVKDISVYAVSPSLAWALIRQLSAHPMGYQKHLNHNALYL
jgi:hypothetical protein